MPAADKDSVDKDSVDKDSVDMEPDSQEADKASAAATAEPAAAAAMQVRTAAGIAVHPPTLSAPDDICLSSAARRPASAIEAIADAAYTANETGEDIGARRLHAVFEQLLEDIAFNAGDEDMPPIELKINGDYVRQHLHGEHTPIDMRRYIL